LIFATSIFTFGNLDEIKREKDFYRLRGLPYPKANLEKALKDANQNGLTDANGNAHNFHREDEQVGLELLTSNDQQLKQLKTRYIRVSSQATITQLKKFIAAQVFKTTDRQKEVRLVLSETTA